MITNLNEFRKNLNKKKSLADKQQVNKIIKESVTQEKEWTEKTEGMMEPSGPSKTVEGEIVRAVNKIVYRFFNDGDFFYKGYGAETAGGAALFLANVGRSIIPALGPLIANMYQERSTNDETYEDFCESLVDIVLSYLNTADPSKYHPNNFDILDYNREAMQLWGDDEDEEDEDYYDDEEDEDVDESKKTKINENKTFTSYSSQKKVTGWLTLDSGVDSLNEPVLNINMMQGSSSSMKPNEIKEMIQYMQNWLLENPTV